MRMTQRSITLGIASVWLAAVVMNIHFLPQRYAMHVQVERLTLAPMPLLVRASGTLEAKDSHTLKLDFDGPILKKQFREGQQVVKGQVLAVVSREKIEVDYQNKMDALKNAQDDLARARKDLRVQKELYHKQAVAYSTIEDAQKTLVKATQALRSAKETFALAQAQWNSSTIVSPIAGTIVKDWIGEDKSVSSGKDIVTVADVSAFTVKVTVDELEIKQVAEGQRAEIKLQIYDQTPLPAIVKEIGSAPEGNGLPEVPVVLLVTDTRGLPLRPKLTAEARIDTGTTEPILSVPLTAVANADGNPHVWVLGAFQRVHAVAVQLGRTSPDWVEVTQGLQAQNQIVITAEPDFAEGMMVLVDPAGAPAPGSSKTHALMKDRVKKALLDKKRGSGPGFIGLP